MLRRCPVHGPFDGSRCPTCRHEGDPLLDEEARTRLSKFLSGALRHFSDDLDLQVDERGWARLADVIEAVCAKYSWAEAEHVRAVIATDPKGRFQTEGDRVRAVYGHSIDVTVDEDRGPVPDRLYHGTARQRVPAIREEGLLPMGRREVHLSLDVETAREVGLRHSEDVAILAVDAEALDEEGIEIQRRGESVFTCERVPAEHVSLLEPDEP